MILFGVPAAVQSFFAPVRRGLSRPLARALPVLVLALLLAPHKRSLKTLAGVLLGDRTHAATISRRLRNPRWRTHDWYTTLYDRSLTQTNDWERTCARLEKRARRQWVFMIDSTFHATFSQGMENLIYLKQRRHPNNRTVQQHCFVFGVVITDKGGRLPLPRKSYYTRDYCAQRGRRYYTQVELAAQMLRAVRVPDDVEVVVVFDSAFDAAVVHQVCRRRQFTAVFPIDPNRTLSTGPAVDAAGVPRAKVVHWTRTWHQAEFSLLELQYENEAHSYVRRRHRDNLRLAKTHRRYQCAARHATVSHLGNCVIVASYKENPKVELAPHESGDWWTYHTAPIIYRKQGRPTPRRWHGKVLACTDPTATARQVIEWYELRWQIELFFRELKSRLQLRGYVLHKFVAVERYLDLLLLGFLLLEQERLRELQAAGPPSARGGEAGVQARTTDRLRQLEATCQQWNRQVVAQRLGTARGRQRLLRDLEQVPCQVA